MKQHGMDDRKIVQRLIDAAEKWARMREINAGRAARNGMIGPSDVAKEEKALGAWIEAKEAATKWFI